jgi:hypothetical protein
MKLSNSYLIIDYKIKQQSQKDHKSISKIVVKCSDLSIKIFKKAWQCDTIGLVDVDRDTQDEIVICKHIHTKITVKLL